MPAPRGVGKDVAGTGTPLVFISRRVLVAFLQPLRSLRLRRDMLILFTILASVVAREISRTLFPQLHLESYIDGVGEPRVHNSAHPSPCARAGDSYPCSF